jgi:DNA-binding MarR family transcriptional regulator
LRELGVTTPQYAVLTFLEQAPGLSSAQLARRAFVTPQTMNRIVANLQAAGLIERDAHPELGRVLEARLTPAGRALLAEAHRRVRAVEDQMAADLTPEEQRQLVRLLEQCMQGLRPAAVRHRHGSPAGAA